MTNPKKTMLVAVIYFVIVGMAFTSAATASIQSKKPALQVRGVTEMGLLVPAYHKIQFSNGNTYFDYRKEGGQDNAFLFLRFSAEAVLGGRHTIVALYQPLQLKTNVTLNEDVRIDNVTFPAQTPMDLLYGFDFYRLSYMVDVLKHRKNTELSLGASLQMRNAVITFTSSDGTRRVANRDVGPVPLLKARFRHQFNNHLWVGAEVDGIWAPIKYINGSNSDVEGAIIDLNVSVGRRLAQSIDGFVNIRYLAGGAEGTSKDTTGAGDGYTRNWLQFLTFSLGVMFSPTDLP